MKNTLIPAFPVAKLYPPDAIYMARTTPWQTRMLGYGDLNIDQVTTHFFGLLNGRKTIRHEAGASPEILDLYHRAGVVIEEETFLYRTADEAFTLAKELHQKGGRFFYPYPLPEGLIPEADQLVSPEIYRYLNDKSNLEKIAPVDNLAKRQKVPLKDLMYYVWSRPVFLKGACSTATGRGFAVRPCPDQASYAIARNWFLKTFESNDTIIIEDWEDVVTCWCVGIVVADDDTTCLGGAEQLFSSPACQSGSIIDPECFLPEEGRILAVQIGEVARKLGFRGVAGLDIGRCRDGRVLVFDPNFRINASSAQLLFHQSATARSGLHASCSLLAKPKGRFRNLLERLKSPIENGWFVPTRVFNGEQYPLALVEHTVIGFVTGCDRQEAQLKAKRLKKSLEAKV